MTGEVLIERDGDIATLALSNPGKLNAITLEMWQGIGNAMAEFSADDDLRCVVMRGAGEEAFAAGADISAFANERSDRSQTEAYHRAVTHATTSTYECRHPTVAMIMGPCIGGGLELAGACDMRICGESSRFGVPINKLGHAITVGELKMLLALVGPGPAKEILLEGRVFGAEEAKAMGLVNRIVPDGEVEAEATAAARRIAEGAPLVARLHKKLIDAVVTTGEVNQALIEESYSITESDDYSIGVEAFLAKKKPKFTGR